MKSIKIISYIWQLMILITTQLAVSDCNNATLYTKLSETQHALLPLSWIYRTTAVNVPATVLLMKKIKLLLVNTCDLYEGKVIQRSTNGSDWIAV